MEEFLTELHMHTDEVSPCGRVPAREGIRIYHEMGYKVVCITDHFRSEFFDRLGDISWDEKVDAYLEGYRKAQDEGGKFGMKVLLGMEYGVPNAGDDILIYGFDESFIYKNKNMHLLNEDGLLALSKDWNLLVIQAHPFRKHITKLYSELVQGYEVFNGNPRHDSFNTKAEEYAKALGSIMISGSDFHQVEDAGTGGVYLQRYPTDSFELADILREIRVPRLIRNDR